MKYQELVVLLPCHSLEDFPVHHEGDEAQGLLAAWSALWHPALIAAAGTPTWSRVDDPPAELADRLLIAPQVSHHELPTGFAQRAKDEGAVLIRRKTDRAEIVDQALESLDGGDRGVDPELAADFLALGYTYLQVELLTRQMRYASNLDELHFSNLVQRAAEHAVEGDGPAAREQLSACFDVLAEERDHYYAVDSYFFDITLTAATTLGADLRDELTRGRATSLMISADDLQRMADDHPETLAALKEAMQEGRACILGGETTEHRWPLMSLESMRRQWRRAAAIYERLLGSVPRVYARRRFGLSPAMPMTLHGMGFEGAIHATLDDGRFPQGVQTKTRWESADGAVLDAIARPPLDATRPETYLGLALKLGETMDSDHVATLVMAHWPGQGGPWLDDLRRVAAYNAPLGKFMRADDFFINTELPGNLDRFEFDQYRSPYLKQAVIRKHEDPISSSVRYWQRQHALQTAETLHGLAECVSGAAQEGVDLESLGEQIDSAAESGSDPQLDSALQGAVQRGAEALSNALPREQAPRNGVLLLNAQSAARRQRAPSSNLDHAPIVERPVFAASDDPALRQIVADTPSFGFTWVGEGQETRPSRKKKKTTPLGASEGNSILLQNEFFEAIINCTTGTLGGLYAYNTRGNRLSQQVALRRPGGADDDAAYSVMAADECRLAYATATEAVAECRGRLLDREGQRLAGFVQRYTIGRGQRVLGITIELEPDTEPKSDAWNSYYACRFAWADETSPLHRTVHQMRVESDAKRFESPHYIDISSGDTTTTILTGGLPFHRRSDFRKLDSLLIVRGESARTFSLGIGVDLKNPLSEAISILEQTPVSLQQKKGPPTPTTSSWLFHVDSRSVVATSLSALYDEGQVVGFRARLLETNGRPSRLTLSGFRPIQSARQVDLRGQAVSECDLEEGGVKLQLAAHEWIEVEARW